ncbi:TIR domain-containing protein [Chloroflexota bacterium]
MDSDELKKMQQYYHSLLAQQRILERDEKTKFISGKSMLPLEHELHQINSEFPSLMTPFDKHPYFSKSTFEDGTLYYLTAIRSYVSILISRLQVAIEETSDIPDRVKTFGNRVFIVHGHDEGVKQTVARFLEKLDLKVVILHEQEDKGKTVIEKLEANSAEIDIGYAVVLLTPDDTGASKADVSKLGLEPSLKDRARQNVVFELGYFIAKLGRPRVRALYVQGVEPPSDYTGVLYTPLDSSGSWKLELAREIKAAGIELDLNKAA